MHKSVQGHAGGEGLPLSFEGPILIVGGGTVDPALLRSVAARCAGMIGADSGGDTISAAGLVPDAVVGDMDSVSNRDGFPARTRIIELREQETTDFEKCLYSTRAPLTIALGMTGGRFDHTLAALHAVVRHAHERHIVLVDAHDLALGVSGPARLNVGTGQRVSVYPLGRTEFSRSKGLLYPLDGLVLEQGGAIGTSNVATEDVVEIEVAAGEQSPWLLIVENRLLDKVIGEEGLGNGG